MQHLYTSTGNEVTLYVSRGRMGEHRSTFDMDGYPRLIISYDGTRTPVSYTYLHLVPSFAVGTLGDDILSSLSVSSSSGTMGPEPVGVHCLSCNEFPSSANLRSWAGQTVQLL